MFNWRPYPFIRLLIPFIGGILTYVFVRIALSIPLFLLVIVWLKLWVIHRSKISYSRRWVFGFLLNILLFILGYSRAEQFHGIHSENHLTAHYGKATHFCGTLADAPIQKSNSTQLLIEVKGWRDSSGSWSESKGKLLMTLYPKDSLVFNTGDQIIFSNQVTPTPPPSNPKAFDYRKYLFFKNIHFQCFGNLEKVKRVGIKEKSTPFSKIQVLRKDLISILENHISQKEELAVAKALILGDKSSIDPQLRNAYAQTGAMHVLAVSGLHVGLIYLIIRGLLAFLTRYLGFLKRIEPFISITGIWTFTLLTGASPSVLRAATMFSFLIAGISLKRYSNVYNTLAASCFCLLWVDPFLAGKVGFQLSYAAIVGIIYFQPKIHALWIPESSVIDFLWQLISVSIAAQIGTLPLTLFYFHQFPWFFWLSGLIVVPAASVILTGGLVLFIGSGISPLFGRVIAWAFEGFLWSVNQLIYLIQSIPYGLYSGVWLAWPTVIFLYLSIFFLIVSIETNRYFHKFLFLLMFLVGTAWTSLSKLYQRSHPEFVVYNIYNASMVDFYHGKRGITIKDEGLSQRKEKFAAESYRMFKGVSKLETIPIDSLEFQTTYLKANGPLIQFGEEVIFILSPKTDLQEIPPIQADYLLIIQSPEIELKEVLEKISCKKVIIDDSNKRYLKEKWRKNIRM